MGAPVLATQWFGCFLYEDGKLREQRLFPKEPTEIASRLRAVRDGSVLAEEREVTLGMPQVVVAHRRLLSLGNARVGEVPHAREDPMLHGFHRDQLVEAATLLARDTVREGLADRTLHLMQAVSLLDESFDVENLLGERLASWYTLHAPEVARANPDHLQLARLVAEHGTRGAMPGASTAESLGSEIPATEVRALQALARALLSQIESRKPLEALIEELTTEIASNLSRLVGPKIAARLIFQAGGLEDLAKLPASTIQTLGAEKALFRHLTQGAPPPKHGVLFQHPLVYRAHPKDRGPIARAIAAKAAIASRADAFTGADIAAQLKAQIEDRAGQVHRVGRRRAMARHERGSKGGSRPSRGGSAR